MRPVTDHPRGLVASGAAVARRYPRVLIALALALALALTVYVVTFLPPRAGSPRVTASVLPAELVVHLETPGPPVTWNQPAALALVGGRKFVLDTGNDRILEIDDAGTIRNTLDGAEDEQLILDSPMAIVSDDQNLYVANSGASEILVLTPAGEVVNRIELTKVRPTDDGLPRPISLAITGDGQLLVSDARNHRVLRYDLSGQLLEAIGAGGRESGTRGFNTPGGIALDGEGNIYVVDILNGRVVELSPDGTFLRQIGELGDTAGTFSRPKDVAVDDVGNIYVSDSLLKAVQAFSPEGEYLGFIGRQKANDRSAGSLFQAPAGLEVDGDTLYVMDRVLGLFVFDIRP